MSETVKKRENQGKFAMFVWKTVWIMWIKSNFALKIYVENRVETVIRYCKLRKIM